jgi:glycosyltransferase involved in cell wall biosynthesis
VSILVPRSVRAAPAAGPRPEARGKFLACGGEKFYARGVTYGTFRPDANGDEFPPVETVRRDFAQMAANGFNAVRTYTMPPTWLLDLAAEEGLYVAISLAAERSVGYLNERGGGSVAEKAARDVVRRYAGHPAVLCYSLGNEIPASVVRWLGARKVEKYLERLFDIAKDADPEGLVTYVNYPSTEYLELPFIDLVAFNVYLEQPDRLAAYLARLQNLAGDRPLLMTELGLDSVRNGEETQASTIDWQVRTAFEAGCAGAFVYSWTDEWHRGGEDVYDWAFGLTDRERNPKPALAAARDVLVNVPFSTDENAPRVSVVICAFNAETTMAECLDAVRALDYPDYEVIVVDDGSTDDTAAIAGRYPVRLVSTENRGLSSARNTGLEHATGDIVAYLDSDAYPDPHWLKYLVRSFTTSAHVGVGGPNLPPDDDGPIAQCVAAAPGGPVHVLLTDDEAEHIPGCNMAFRVEALRAINGFDPRFRAAGDDVDVCWRLQDAGGTLGFSPAALVWHHRRNSVLAYWRQQRGYGRAEALLEGKFPHRYNTAGHVTWGGRIYGRGFTLPLRRERRIYHGTWGAAPFQSLYQREPGTLASLPLMPEWFLLTAVLAGLSCLGVLWRPFLLALPLLVAAVGAVIVQAVRSARGHFPARAANGHLSRMRALTATLHVLQPLARLRGRLTNGLTPWRHHRHSGFRLPRRRSGWAWSKTWIAPDERLREVEQHAASSGGTVLCGGAFDRWDLELRGGIFGGARTLMAVEELGGGAQLVRYRFWPIVGRVATLLPISAGAVALAAALDGAAFVAALAGIVAVILVVLMFVECGAACGVMASALESTVGRTAELVVETRHEGREARRAPVGPPQAVPSEGPI